MHDVVASSKPEDSERLAAISAINLAFGSLASAALAAAAVVVLMVAVISESFNPARVAVALTVLIVVHAVRFPRLMFCREFGCYAALFAFILLSLLWAPDVVVAMNTVLPALNFLLTLFLFGSLMTYHDRAAVLYGSLGALVLGALVYSYKTHFPFARPVEFSYNAMANMYLFGFLVALMLGWYCRKRVMPIAVGSLLLLLIVATTSIKTNLGVLLGAFAIALFYFRHFIKVMRRAAIVIIVLLGGLAYWAVSNEALMGRLGAAYDRVSLGIGVLTARDDAEVRGKGLGLARRVSWKKQGIKGWLTSPVLGNGAEAFRSDYGITSHSSPVDLLYNFGVVGLVLFYGVFASIAQRLRAASTEGAEGLCALTFGALVCYLFMSASGTLYYNSFIAAFLAICTALLRSYKQRKATPSDLDQRYSA